MRVRLGILVAILSVYGGIAGGATARALQDSVVALISREQSGFRLARPDDFLPSLAGKNQGPTFIQADFNRDNRLDSAVLVINDDMKEYRVYLVIGGQEHPRLLFSRKWTTLSDGHPIRTPMFLKPIGEAGPSGLSYSPLRGGEARRYTAVPAVEVWTGQQHDERDAHLADLAYCSMTWYYDQSQLKSFQVCD